MKSKKLSYNKILILFCIIAVSVLMTGCWGPIVNIFSASPSTINQGESSILTWSVSNADTVTITSIGTVASSDSTSVSPVVTTTYTLIATNYVGSVTKTCTVKVAVVAVGDSYGGGIVAYILQSGDTGYDANVQHGLIAATADQSIGIQWNNGSFVATGATGTAIGTGQANTTAIVTIQGAGSYAAQLCNDLTAGGYNDWFLPSKDELNKLYINKDAIGGFAGSYYWSSSEGSTDYAWIQYFHNGNQYYGYKYDDERVRAVRAF